MGNIRARLLWSRIVTGDSNITTMCVIIITEKRLHKFTTFIILTFDDNIWIIGLMVEHTDRIIGFVRTERSFLLSESKTEMRFVRTLDDIIEKIIFSIIVVFDILKNEMAIEVIREEHKFLVGTIGRKRFQRIINIGENRIVENAISKLTRFIEFVGIKESEEMTTIGLFMIERVLQVEFRDEVFDLGTAIRVIEIDTVTIWSRKMTDNMHGIDKSIGLLRFFNIELDGKIRKNRLDFGSEEFDGLMTLRVSLRVIFTIIIEEEVNHIGVLARFAKTIVLAIFFRNVDKLLMRGEFKITIEITSREDNMRIRINISTREFDVVLKFFIESLRTFKIIHVGR